MIYIYNRRIGENKIIGSFSINNNIRYDLNFIYKNDSQ